LVTVIVFRAWTKRTTGRLLQSSRKVSEYKWKKTLSYNILHNCWSEKLCICILYTYTINHIGTHTHTICIYILIIIHTYLFVLMQKMRSIPWLLNRTHMYIIPIHSTYMDTIWYYIYNIYSRTLHCASVYYTVRKIRIGV